MSYGQVVKAQELSRLFTTYQERVKINKLRLQKRVQKLQEKKLDKVEITEVPEPPEKIVLNGLIKGSNGTKIVWINGQMWRNDVEMEETRFSINFDEMNHIENANVPIILSKTKKTVKLLPGQVLDTLEREIEEVYGKGKIEIN